MSRAAIAGGGIAGMAAGLALARAGWEVDLFEQRAALGEVGAGLQMSPNACKVLRWLDVLPEIATRAFHPISAVLRDGLDASVIYTTKLADGAEDRWDAPYFHVHRADLLGTLTRAAHALGVRTHLDVQVERAVEHPSSVALHLKDTKIIQADLLLGADGIHSNLRKALYPDEAPRFTGQIAWRAIVPADAVPEGTIPPDATVWAGEGRHLVTYYLRGGSAINLVAVVEQDAWTEEGWSAPGDPEALRAAFNGWNPDVQALLGAVTSCFLWGLFDRPEQVRWVRDRLALIGDAAHPMLPFMAQGAAQALEDVAMLVRCLTDAPVKEALQTWEDARWPRVIRVLEQSRSNGRLFHQPPGLSRAVHRGVIQAASRVTPGLAASRLDWLYGFDPVTGI